jgi:acetyl-CoA C-acetyltransferase
MGNTAENVAKLYKITRREADEFAKISVDRAMAALQRGFFTEEITPINATVFEAEKMKPRKVSLSKKVINFTTDENIRPTFQEDMAKLPSSFEKEGVQTAANSSGIVDGAASAIIANNTIIAANKLKPLTKVVASVTTALDPNIMGLGPVSAIRLLLEIAGLKLSDIGLFEINEAFAAQFIGCERELELDRNICNVNGGAIALGHPLAASGLRLSLTLSREMNSRKVKYGIASACIGGGQGNAILFENINL